MAKSKGVFIVLEGPDKSGKSTQASLLVQALLDSGRTVVHTREPGGSEVPFAEAIRKLLLDPKHKVQPLAELFLYEAARVQHTEDLVMPALKRGAVVVSERYTLATVAYQGHARGLPLPLIHSLNRVATGGLDPHLTFVLDIPDSQFKKRDPFRELDRLERESMAFRRKVRDAYRKLSKKGSKIRLVNADQNRHTLHVEIVSQTAKALKLPLKPVPFDPALLG